MKKILVILVAIVGIGISTNAQQCTTSDGRWTCIETSEGTLYSINDNVNKICYVIEFKNGQGCDYVRVKGKTEWEKVEEFVSKATIKAGIKQVLQGIIGSQAAATVGGAIVNIFNPSPAY